MLQRWHVVSAGRGPGPAWPDYPKNQLGSRITTKRPSRGGREGPERDFAAPAGEVTMPCDSQTLSAWADSHLTNWRNRGG